VTTNKQLAVIIASTSYH